MFGQSFERTANYLIFIFVTLLFTIFNINISGAGIVVDPDGVGAIDVVRRFNSFPIPIPIRSRDPLELGDYGLIAGNTSAGTIAVDNGGTISSAFGYIGYDTGSTGSASVVGVGSAWKTDDFLNIGREGTGVLAIRNGGAVTTNGPVSVNPSQNGSHIIFDNGMLTAETLYAAPADLIGIGTNITEELQIGTWGDGNITIENGGRMQNASAYIGGGAKYRRRNGLNDSTGSVTVDGDGSTWENQGSLFVGTSDGIGTLSIQNNATVSAGSVFVNEKQSGSRINFANGTLTAYGGVVASPNDLLGVGTIDAQGWVFDSDLIFSNANDLIQNLVLNELPGQNILVNLDFSGYISLLGAGAGDDGSLIIRDGLRIASRLGYLGYQASGFGRVTIDGAGSTWDTDLAVGVHGTGILAIRNGGSMESGRSNIGLQTGSLGEVLVDGTDSSWTSDFSLSVGKSGTGLLAIRNGATVTSRRSTIGSGPSATGTVIVSGPGSTWNGEYSIAIGASGIGTLTIQNGGMVNGSGLISRNPGSTGAVIVDGSDSSWISNGGLFVGREGVGTLKIRNGGTVNVPNVCIECKVVIGDMPGSMGNVIVEGLGSAWNISGRYADLYVGKYGNGTLVIRDGGQVTVDGDAWVNSPLAKLLQFVYCSMTELYHPSANSFRLLKRVVESKERLQTRSYKPTSASTDWIGRSITTQTTSHSKSCHGHWQAISIEITT